MQTAESFVGGLFSRDNLELTSLLQFSSTFGSFVHLKTSCMYFFLPFSVKYFLIACVI